jgi:hypothetical protein
MLLVIVASHRFSLSSGRDRARPGRSVLARPRLGAQHLGVDVAAPIAQHLVVFVPVPLAPRVGEVGLGVDDLLALRAAQNACGKPASLNALFAVCRDAMVTGTVNGSHACGLVQTS